ncbi:MAG: hypothetical protein ACK5RL_03940 [Acidimicrobiales bacterium]
MPALTLPRGLIDRDGGRHRSVELVAPDGWLERTVTDAIRSAAPDPVTRLELLASGIERIGGYDAPDPSTLALLARAELDLVGFWLRRAVCGDALRLVVRCPVPTCGELADVDLTVGDLLPDDGPPEPEWFAVDAGPAGRAAFRPITAADEVVMAEVGGTDRERTDALLARLIRSVEPAGPVATSGSAPADQPVPSPLPEPLRNAVLLALVERPAAATTRLEVGCPACRAPIEVRLDPLVLLARELRSGGDRLVVETHCLAFHYGWSEDDILGLPKQRRWQYLSLLRAELTGAPLSTAVADGW